MHIQTASHRLPAGRCPLPAWMAVSLPCDPPRRPWPGPRDPRGLRIPTDEATVHCPDPRLPAQLPRPSLQGLLPC